MKKEFCCECWNCKEKVIIFSWDGSLKFNGFYHSYHAPQILIPSIQRHGDHWANTCECGAIQNYELHRDIIGSIQRKQRGAPLYMGFDNRM